MHMHWKQSGMRTHALPMPPPLQPLEAHAWLQPLPDLREQRRKERRQRNIELMQLRRDFNAPLDHLDEETRARVQEGRLQVRAPSGHGCRRAGYR
jgi:hypothetical protein